MLDTMVDVGQGKEDGSEERRRKTCKQPAGQKRPAKKKPRRAVHDDDDDDDEEGRDDDEPHNDMNEGKENEEMNTSKADDCNGAIDEEKVGDAREFHDAGNEGADVDDDDEAGITKRKGRAKAKAKAKAKEKAASKPTAKPKALIRDQSKSKKLNEVWSQLPEEFRTTFNAMSRDDKTLFVNGGIERSDGKLIVNQEAMWALVIQREEQQRGREQMSGYILEDIWGHWRHWKPFNGDLLTYAHS